MRQVLGVAWTQYSGEPHKLKCTRYQYAHTASGMEYCIDQCNIDKQNFYTLTPQAAICRKSKPSETVSALLSGTASSDQVNLPARSPVVRAARGLSSSASDWLLLSSPATTEKPLMTKNARSVLLLHHCCGCCCGSLALSQSTPRRQPMEHSSARSRTPLGWLSSTKTGYCWLAPVCVQTEHHIGGAFFCTMT